MQFILKTQSVHLAEYMLCMLVTVSFSHCSKTKVFVYSNL